MSVLYQLKTREPYQDHQTGTRAQAGLRNRVLLFAPEEPKLLVRRAAAAPASERFQIETKKNAPRKKKKKKKSPKQHRLEDASSAFAAPLRS